MIPSELFSLITYFIYFLQELKTGWGEDSYVTNLPFHLRKPLTCLRISSHKLPIETGRYSRPIIPRQERYCIYCTEHGRGNLLGDERHLLTKCIAIERAITLHKSKPPTDLNKPKSLFEKSGNELKIFANYVKNVYENFLSNLK